MAKNTGWVPQQHGAWAMLAVPSILGTAAHLGLGGGLPGPLTMVAAMFAGYFCFNATSLWLKAPARRRSTFARPVVAYGALTLALGVAAVALTTPWVLAWGLVYAPLVLLTLLLVAARRERSLASGLATVAASSVFLTTLAHPDPRGGLTWLPVALTLACFAYFAGTVFVVKTVIRERGRRGWQAASALWHAAATLAAGAWAGTLHPDARWLGLALTGFFAATTAKALAVPQIDARHRLRAPVLGAIESVFSVVALAIGLAAILSGLPVRA